MYLFQKQNDSFILNRAVKRWKDLYHPKLFDLFLSSAKKKQTALSLKRTERREWTKTIFVFNPFDFKIPDEEKNKSLQTLEASTSWVWPIKLLNYLQQDLQLTGEFLPKSAVGCDLIIGRI